LFLPARTERLRQEHIDPDRRRPRAGDQRPRARPKPASPGPSAPAGRGFGHGMAELESFPLAQRHRQHRLRARNARRFARRTLRARQWAHCLGRAARVRAPPAGTTVRRHAPARRARPRPDHGAADPADGRALRRARRADQDRDAGGAAEDLRPDPQNGPVRDARDRGGNPARRRSGGDDGAPRPHQGSDSDRPPAPTIAGNDQFQGIRRAVRPHVPSHPRRGHGSNGAAGGHGGGPAMTQRVGRMTKLAEKVLPTLSILIFLLAWEVLVRWRGIAPIFLPAPTSIAVQIWRMVADGTMEFHLGVTLLRIFAGFLVAAVSGIALGLLMGMSRIVSRVADLWIAALYPLPKISLIPLLIIWLGTGEAYRIVISAITAFFPIVISTYSGIRQADRGLIKAAQDLGANARQVQFKVVIPAAMPSILSGLQLGMGVTIILIVA